MIWLLFGQYLEKLGNFLFSSSGHTDLDRVNLFNIPALPYSSGTVKLGSFPDELHNLSTSKIYFS